MELNLRTRNPRQEVLLRQGLRPLQQYRPPRRTGIHELVIFNDELRDLVSSAPPPTSCGRLPQTGMTTLREAGLRAIFNG